MFASRLVVAKVMNSEKNEIYKPFNNKKKKTILTFKHEAHKIYPYLHFKFNFILPSNQN